MAEDNTGTETGAEPQGQTSAPTPETPTGKTFTEAEVAAARRDAERKAKEATAETAALRKRIADLETAQTEWDQQRQAAEDAKKSDLERALERVTKAEQTVAAERAAREKAERDALVASVVAERGMAIPKPFLALVEGDSEETIGMSLETLMELGRKTFAPKSIGASNSPPNEPQLPDTNERATWLKRVEELNAAASDPRHPQHKGAIQELAKLYGR